MVQLTPEERARAVELDRAIWSAELALTFAIKQSSVALNYSWADRDAIVGFLREVLRASNGLDKPQVAKPQPRREETMHEAFRVRGGPHV